ncbi:MAG: NAD(P)-binding protein, partial [Bacteroidota bacterium]
MGNQGILRRTLKDAVTLRPNYRGLSQLQTISLPPEEALHDESLAETIGQRAGLDPTDAVVIRKRSIDARGRRIQVHVAYEVFRPGALQETIRYTLDLPDVTGAPEVHIIGAGPAGLFAALRLIEDGLRPILFERGKDVRARRRDIAAINKDQV